MRWHFAPHQLVWIAAAITLRPRDRVAAYEEIAEMCICPFSAVVLRAEQMISAKPPRKRKTPCPICQHL